MNKNNQEQEENFMTRQEVLMTFAQGAKKILEIIYLSLLSMVLMLVVIIRKIQILML